jgi:hypothetical protein
LKGVGLACGCEVLVSAELVAGHVCWLSRREMAGKAGVLRTTT